MHEVIVYDENGDESEKTIQHINVTHMKRYKHVIGDYTTYSFNYYYENGTIYFGEIPMPSLADARMKLSEN